MVELETTINETVETAPAAETTETEESTENTELARLRAEFAKQKLALDKATKEAAAAKRSLRAKQTEEEIAAEEKRLQDEAKDAELAELRKRFAVAEMSKKVMGFVGDESTANVVAESLYGAEGVDTALAAISKAWTAREKALRLEYGKITAPGVGGSDGPTITKEQLAEMSYKDRLQFATEHPDEYNKMMGR